MPIKSATVLLSTKHSALLNQSQLKKGSRCDIDQDNDALRL